MPYNLETAAQNLKDAPADSRHKPEQWCVGTIERAETRVNAYAETPFDEINIMVRLRDYDGNPRGVEFLVLGAPPKGSPGFVDVATGKPTKAWNFRAGQFKRFTNAILAPGVPEKEADAAVLAAAQAAGSIEAAMIGRTNLYHITVNDGLDKKTGAVKSAARVDKPRNEISAVIADTPENRAKYNAASIAAAQAARPSGGGEAAAGGGTY